MRRYAPECSALAPFALGQPNATAKVATTARLTTFSTLGPKLRGTLPVYFDSVLLFASFHLQSFTTETNA